MQDLIAAADLATRVTRAHPEAVDCALLQARFVALTLSEPEVLAARALPHGEALGAEGRNDPRARRSVIFVSDPSAHSAGAGAELSRSKNVRAAVDFW